jgi:hypothetical protein
MKGDQPETRFAGRSFASTLYEQIVALMKFAVPRGLGFVPGLGSENRLPLTWAGPSNAYLVVGRVWFFTAVPTAVLRGLQQKNRR